MGDGRKRNTAVGFAVLPLVRPVDLVSRCLEDGKIVRSRHESVKKEYIIGQTHQCSVLVNGSIHNTLSATPIPSLSKATASPLKTEDMC